MADSALSAGLCSGAVSSASCPVSRCVLSSILYATASFVFVTAPLSVPHGNLVVYSLPVMSASHPAVYNPQEQGPFACFFFFFLTPAVFKVPCTVLDLRDVLHRYL